MSNEGVKKELTAEEWIACLVGRDWEIFWNTSEEGEQEQQQPQEPEASQNNASSDCISDDQGTEEPQKNNASSTGIHDQEIVDAKDAQAVDKESTSASKDVEMKEANDEEKEEVEFDEDWYHARVEGVVMSNNKKWQANQSPVFQVRFEGDDELYEMTLAPEIVRPCAKSWIRRTRALMMMMMMHRRNHEDEANCQSVSQSNDTIDGWEDSLPPDTMLPEDNSELEAIRKAVHEEFKDLELPLQNINESADHMKHLPASDEEPNHILRLVVLIRQQIFLRSRLAAMENTERPRSGEDGDPPPTEAYCNFLVNSLKDLENCVLWYYQCYQLFIRILQPPTAAATSTNGNGASTENSSNLVRRDDLFECIDGGRRTMLALVTMDSSSAGYKRRRKNDPLAELLAPSTASSSPEASRRTKRRRKNHTLTEEWFVWKECDEGRSPMQQNAITSLVNMASMEVEDFLSFATVKKLVETLAQYDRRWYSLSMGRMLLALCENVVTVYIKWERRSEYYLGIRKKLDVASSDGETSAEDADSESDDMEENDASDYDDASKLSRNSSRRLVTNDDLKSVVESAQHDRILKQFDLAGLYGRLTEKLANILKFEEETNRAIESVLDESTVSALDHSADTILSTLETALESANSRESAVGNMEHTSSPLTRTALETALIYRTWFLDLKYAESVRERVSFLESVVSRASRHPGLPSRVEGNNTLDASTRLLELSPRLQALKAKTIEHVAVFTKYKSLLVSTQKSGKLNIDAALAELGGFPVLSAAEEMAAVRKDVLAWVKAARGLLSNKNPRFDDLVDLRKSLDAILNGRSQSRIEMVKDLHPNAEVDDEIIRFARSDVEANCNTLDQQIIDLHTRASYWKERCNSVLTILRSHGNPHAGERIALQKNQQRVGLLRIQGLLDEYNELEIDLTEDHNHLRKVYDDAVSWSSKVTAILSNEAGTFDEALDLVDNDNRPSGIILDPTRTLLDSLGELLQWHKAVKMWMKGDEESKPNHGRLYHLLIEGVEIIEEYSRNRGKDSEFVVDRKAMLEHLTTKRESHKQIRMISLSNLADNAVTYSFLRRVMNTDRDQEHGYPLFCMLYHAWQVTVEVFAEGFSSATDADSRSSFTLEHGVAIRRMKPTISQELNGDPSCLVIPQQDTEWMVEFERLVNEGEHRQQSILDVVVKSRPILRDCLNRVQDVATHLAALKELQASIKTHPGIPKSLCLDRSLEQQLTNDLKTFGWLARALQYPAIQAGSSVSDLSSTDDRIPWQVLVKLYDGRPVLVEDEGLSVQCVVLRVKELHEEASAWQSEISKLTTLSMRGMEKRRSASTLSGGGEIEIDEPASIRIDEGKLSELSNSPIMKKVIMPREEAMHAMSEATNKFEVVLQDFLRKDYGGESPDRAPYPHASSLVDEDGKFILYRLTGSPLFDVLKRSIADISKVASDVLADTPGKATFDWITRAVGWIESLNAAVTATPRLGIPGVSAKKVLKEGESTLLAIPDDLRKTLSQHRIFVSTTKDGKLTVKSKKGGAHHSVGITAIRWSPILYESLKADVARMNAWEARMNIFFTNCTQFCHSVIGLALDEPAVLRYHQFRDEITGLMDEFADLVVVPSRSVVDNGRTILFHFEGILKANSTPAVAKKAAEAMYKVGSAVVRDRFLLLNALVDRQVFTEALTEPLLEEDDSPNESHFRRACRLLMEKSLRKGTKLLDLDQCGTVGLIRVKAWELEESLFQHFQGERGEKQISVEYRDQARTLKRFLENVDDAALFLRFMCNEASADDLAKMTIEQLASQKTKRSRAKVEAAAKRSTMLTINASAKADKDATEASLVNMPSVAFSNQCEMKAQQTWKDTRNDAEESTTSKAKPVREAETLKLQTKLGDIVKTKRSSAPPPPPPSLVVSAGLMQPQKSFGGEPISSSSGSDTFFLSMANRTRLFHAQFYAESQLNPSAIDILPEELTEKGRLPVDEFSKFVGEKMGKWGVHLLRLATISDKDAKEYRKFYKDYEQKGRIAMFALESGKLFLLTPKFHRAAKSLGLTLGTNSTYGILLLRR